MEYIHVANIDLEIENPLHVFLTREKEKGKDSRNIK